MARFLAALLVAFVAGSPGRALASYFVCAETVNAGPSATVEQFPASLVYEFTVTEAMCQWCATQDPNAWCHTYCPGGATGAVYGETDPVLEALVGPISWAFPPSLPPEWQKLPFWLYDSESVTTTVTATLSSYAQCATWGRALQPPALPDADGVVTIVDAFRVVWNPEGQPYAECSAKVTCLPPQGQTRTLGYFKTHPEATRACMDKGPVDLGFISVSTAEEALGLLAASPSKYFDGTRRSQLDQARVLLGRQLLVAICNGRVFGSSPADSALVPAAVAALSGSACASMSVLQGQLDAFNNSGDTGENYFGSAAPMSYRDPTVKTTGVCR